jgi:cell division septal protein FtsQ
MGARPLSGFSLPEMPSWPVFRRRLLMALAVVVVLGAAYVFWFRNSSFVQVERVEVVGAEESPQVSAALTAEAGSMTTLHVDDDALRAAVADDPAVLSISTDADFPHGLTITVDLRRPAGYLDADGGTVVAGDGVILGSGVDPPDGLPTIDAEPTSTGAKVEGPALVAARILGAAPAALLAETESSNVDPENGPVVTLTGGLELRFGDPSKADQKWRAAAAVLANPTFHGAAYIDLSVPSRPVSG